MSETKIIGWIVGAVLLVIFILTLFVSIPAGHRGVVLRFGAVTGRVMGEGLHVKTPFIERVVRMDVQNRKLETDADAASRDLQSVNETVALNFALQPDNVDNIYQELRKDYVERVVFPSIQEAVKAASAEFTAEQLITKRQEVRERTKELIAEKLEPQGFIIRDFNIVNFSFSSSFDEAIEKKVTAEQDALAAKNKLEQVKFEAEQAIEEARGKAEAIRIEANALSRNPAIIELRAIEKWNGIMPHVTGGATPFFNVN